MANDINAVTSWWPVSGKATFTTTSEGVDVAVIIKNCRAAYIYPVSMYDGSCADLQATTKPWDGDRGNVKVNTFCLGAPGERVYDSRPKSDPKRWTVGGPSASNLVGRAIAVLDPETHEPLACGTIALPDGGVLEAAPDAMELPSTSVIAQVAGICLLGHPQGEPDGGVACPDPTKVADCALVHCVAGCLSECSEYIACLESSPMCTNSCVPEAACNKCLDGVQCAYGHCRKEFSCAPPPTPNGPCSEFRACCMRQGPLMDSCLLYANQLEELSGDPSCLGAIHDWDVNFNFVYRSPCDPELGIPSE